MHRRSAFSDYGELGRFTMLLCRGLARLLFCTLNLPFGGVLVGVVVVVFLSSLKECRFNPLRF